jgi:hypothetical protein
LIVEIGIKGNQQLSTGTMNVAVWDGLEQST